MQAIETIRYFYKCVKFGPLPIQIKVVQAKGAEDNTGPEREGSNTSTERVNCIIESSVITLFSIKWSTLCTFYETGTHKFNLEA
jgi:hypothetical protein